MHHKEPANPIQNKSTKVDAIITSKTRKNPDKISISYAPKHIKAFLLKNTRSTKSMTGVISGVVTPKDKSKSNPLARLKIRIFSKSVIGF